MENNRKQKKNRNNKTLCDQFFEKGKSEVKERLVQAIRTKRTALNISQQYIDEICFLNEDPLCTCSKFEEKPSLINADIFCRVAAAIGLNLDDALNVDFYLPENLEIALREMKLNKGGLGATCGASEKVRVEKVAPIYLMSEILQEL